MGHARRVPPELSRRVDQPLIAAPVATPITPAVATATAALLAQPTSVAQAQPEHRGSGAVLEQYVTRTDESQILDKWKDSGKPLR